MFNFEKALNLSLAEFGYFDDMSGIAEDILSRFQYAFKDEPDLSMITDLLNQAMDEALIYYNDQWAIIKHYCTPVTACLVDAWEGLFQDLFNIIADCIE